MPVWMLVPIIWAALGLLAIAIRPILDSIVQFEAEYAAAKWITGVFLLPAFLIVLILRLLWKLLVRIMNPIFGGMMFKSLRMTRIWYQIGKASVAKEEMYANRDPDLWGLQRHIDRGWAEEVAICVSEALLSQEFHGWMYCVLLHRLSIAVERGQLSSESHERVREAVTFCEQNRSGELHFSSLAEWVGYVHESLDAAEGSA